MPVTSKIILTALLIGILVLPVDAIAKKKASTAPTFNQGQKWRIGYYEGGSYVNYPSNLRSV